VEDVGVGIPVDADCEGVGDTELCVGVGETVVDDGVGLGLADDAVGVGDGVGENVFFGGVPAPRLWPSPTEMRFVAGSGSFSFVTATSKVASRGPSANHSPFTTQDCPGLRTPLHVLVTIRKVDLLRPTSGTLMSDPESFTTSKDSMAPTVTISSAFPGSTIQLFSPTRTRLSTATRDPSPPGVLPGCGDVPVQAPTAKTAVIGMIQ